MGIATNTVIKYTKVYICCFTFLQQIIFFHRFEGNWNSLVGTVISMGWMTRDTVQFSTRVEIFLFARVQTGSGPLNRMSNGYWGPILGVKIARA
jgi:hypothetical protein